MTTNVATNAGKTQSPLISGLEFLLAAAIVLLHNIWHLVPNEVPILFVLALLSFKLRDGNFSAINLRSPRNQAAHWSWTKTILVALAAAVLRLALGAAWESVSAHFWPAIKGPAGSDNIIHNWKVALEWLAVVWTFAAFGEEIGYRGYIFNRCAEIFGATTKAYWIALLPMAILFGYGHYYKGPAGIVDSTMAGVILGVVYIVSKRNFWVCVLTHGFIDTIGVILAFMGWAT